MNQCNPKSCLPSWSGSNANTHDGQDVNSHVPHSTLSSASDESTSLTRTDLSPLSLNGHSSSAETSPAPSSGSTKTRRSSSVMDADDDDMISSSAPIPAWKRRKPESASNCFPFTSTTLSTECATQRAPASGSFSTAKSEGSSSPNSQLSRTLFVENLVDAAVVTISSIWGRFSRESRLNERGMATPNKMCHNNPLPLTLFVREILRRSRTSCSTLQAALLYCTRCKSYLQELIDKTTSSHASSRDPNLVCLLSSSASPSFMACNDSNPHSTSDSDAASESSGSKIANYSHIDMPVRTASPLFCGRRMFLAAIVVASKFLQDRTYSNRTWSKISGLQTIEIDQIERVFLQTIRYDLVVSDSQWSKWTMELSLFRSRLPTAPNAQQVVKSTSHFPAKGLHRVTSENVIGQALQFDASLNDRHSNAVRGKHAFARHGSSL